MSKTTIPTGGITADAIDGTLIADDAINSEHYTDGSIDTAHIGDSQVTAAKATGIGGVVLTGSDSTSSNVSAVTINGCFSATYRQYLVIFDMTPDTNGENPRIQFTDSSNSVISPSKYGYGFLGLDFGGGEERFTQDNNESHLQIGQGTFNQSNTDYPALSGYLWIVNPFSSSNNVNWHGQIMNRGNNGEDRIYVGSGRLDVQTQCAGLKFFFSSGNVNNATAKVYGLVDS